jgi:opacity protein-like surface antigen
MKKLIILVSAVALSGTMFAQKAGSDNPYSLEGVINASKDGIAWSAPSARLRYFFKDNMAIRASFGINLTTEDVVGPSPGFDANGNPLPATSESQTSGTTNYGLALEYHLAGTDRMSPYFFGGIQIDRDARAGDTDTDFSLGAGAGIDFYVYDNLYLGVEMGLSYGNNDDVASTSIAGRGNMRMGWRF